MMRVEATLALLCLSATAVVSSSVSAPDTALTAAPGDVALLPCYGLGNVTPSLTTWRKDGLEVTSGGPAGVRGPQLAGQRLSVLHDGSLNIREVARGDEGRYTCDSSLPDNSSFQAAVQLQVTSGPDNVYISVDGPVATLPNGTLIARRHSLVSFNCSSSSYPSQELTWAFSGDSFTNDSLVSNSSSWLAFRLETIQSSNQGVYTCRAHNSVSHQSASNSTQLLVYYVPERHPECLWIPAEDPSRVQFSCSWLGAYPPPMLRWGEEEFQVTESLSETLNRSVLSEDQTLTCSARHQLLAPGSERSCSFTLRSPYPEGEPLVTALEETNVTLTCTESTSLPPANTTWRKGLHQDPITPGSKYAVSEEGADLRLTLFNISKDDEGVYFCRSENPLVVRELEVYLTVRKASSAYTGAIIGVFIAALIVGSTVIIAKTLYAGRHRICLGGGFGQMNDDGDVLSLVDSDDEQIFQDTVPRLPPETNGHHTTLVQIHRIPSTDNEEADPADTSAQQQEDTVQTEEPEDLITY